MVKDVKVAYNITKQPQIVRWRINRNQLPKILFDSTQQEKKKEISHQALSYPFPPKNGSTKPTLTHKSLDTQDLSYFKQTKKHFYVEWLFK